MSLCKKSLSVILSFVLVFTMLGGVAYADPLESEDTAGPSVEQSEDRTDKDVSDELDEELIEVEEEIPSDDVIDETESNNMDEEETINASDEEKISKAADDVVEYVYLDENIISLDQDQNIAFGLLDENAVIIFAEAEFIRADNGKKEVFSSEVMADNAALFTMEFTEAKDATSYTLAGITYQIKGSDETYYADFGAVVEKQKGGSYYFEVVTPEVYAALNNAPSEEGEATAFAIKDDGELVAAHNVEEAIEVADSEGVYDDFTTGESIELTDGTGSSGEEGLEEAKSENNPPDSGLLSSLFGVDTAYAAKSSAREKYLFVALDPGHGGSESGAVANGLVEKDINWKIASACKNELEKYSGITVILTRGESEYVGLQARVDRAVAAGADVFVSLHNNAGGGTGAEVWVPNSSSYNKSTNVEGTALGNKILTQLSALGLTNRGVKTRDSTNGGTNPDGSIADYYSVISASRMAGIPGIIVEHAFMDNANDAAFLKNDSNLAKLGQADAKGIANQYGLLTHSNASKNATVKYRAHVSYLGWQSYVYDQKVAGTEGKGRSVEALNIQLQNQGNTTGGIQYRTYVGSSWQDWKTNGTAAGTIGQSKSVQAMQVKLTGNMASKYDVYYRVHVAYVGWLGWAKNGASAGSIGYGYNAEAYEVILVPKGSAAPGSTATPLKQKGASSTVLKYQAHVSSIGWQSAVGAGGTAGTTGKGNVVEALKVYFSDQKYSGGVQYNAHCAYLGWQGWKSNGAQAGTTGQSRQMEAIQIKLTGEMASKYDIYYRVHSSWVGWSGWAKNGASAGTKDYGYAMEALQIKLVDKGKAAPGSVSNTLRQPSVKYQSHVAYQGWQKATWDGGTSGTTGKNLAVEALTVVLPKKAYSGSIQYSTHVSYEGWQGWRSEGAVSGTTGQSKQTEAIKIKLTGTMAEKYDIYYRTHCSYVGWTGWAKNGAECGTSGYGYSMQALQIKLVTKGNSAPGSTSNVFHKKPAGTPIMGASTTTANQMAKRYNVMGKLYPYSVYAKKGAADINAFCAILLEEAKTEGVRAEVVFAQSMHETGWLQFGGDVKANQCNFAGIGATGGVPGNSFTNVRIGLRAQVQHLKAYASTAGLNNACVDPRFTYVSRGCAPTVEDLGGKWATGSGYGNALVTQINALLATK